MDQRLDARIAALEAELNKLKAHVAGDDESTPRKSDRRSMVKLLAAGAVGAVTGAAALSAQPAAALDGDSVFQGLINDATNATQLFASADTALVLGSGAAYGLETDGLFGNALFVGSDVAPTGSGEIGVLYVDGAGDWWAATATSTTNGLWRKLAGPGTAGQLHVLPAPKRVYDSRPGEAPTGANPKAPLAGNTARTIDTTFNASGVPATATAVLVNLTITKPQAAGFATAWPSGPWPGTSNINFATGQDIAATTVVGCGPNATIQIQANTVTDFLLDVIGYYQ
jgi:hypothetical protein